MRNLQNGNGKVGMSAELMTWAQYRSSLLRNPEYSSSYEHLVRCNKSERITETYL